MAWRSDPATAPQILLVAAENCAFFKAYLSCLTHLGRLARIVFDEAHLMLKHASFRPCFLALEFFGSIPAPIVLMTATCTKEMERQLFAMMGRAVFRTLRQPCDRAEIAHSVTEVPTSTSSEFEEAVAIQITTAVKELQGTCDRMAELLGWLPYHSSITAQDRSINLRAWREGRIQGLSCTSMLNCCLDYPAVRFIFHLGQPRDVVDYWQAVGRSSRDGDPGRSIIFVPPLDQVKQFKAGVDDVFGTLVIAKMIYDHICRRLHPVTFLDGHAVTCSMLPLAQMCDVCFQQFQQLASGTLPQFDASYHSPHRRPSTSLIKPTSPPVNPLHALSVLPTHPLRQPAPQASFANRLLAAWKVLESRHEQRTSASVTIALLVLKACRSLCTICVACWFHGALLQSQSHRLQDCERHGNFFRTPAWDLWKKELRLPVGCCYFCGCPQKTFSKSMLMRVILVALGYCPEAAGLRRDWPAQFHGMHSLSVLWRENAERRRLFTMAGRNGQGWSVESPSRSPASMRVARGTDLSSYPILLTRDMCLCAANSKIRK
ncbi:P-loop containing nucleoside triphosphate hydrolase protein [Salix suchowensis]|nr:P-loop containing nucleoside triphosphate hydrolase protein [Salix suchowensis]